MSAVLSALFALLAAVGNASGTVLQRAAAVTVPHGDAFSVRLVGHLWRRPVWLGGIAVIVAAAACQALALNLGSLSLVQPILVTELPFTLLIAAAHARRRLPAAGWAASVMVAAGLGLALAAAAPSGGHSQVAAGLWALTLLCTTGTMALCVLAALPRPRGRSRAALFSSASAIGYALTATLMTAATDVFAREGASAFLAAWQFYGFVATGAIALFLLANAMESGPLIASQPALTLGEALVSLALGMLVYGERVRTGWWLFPEAVGAVLVTWGVLVLPRVDTKTPREL
ncbi:DMT family transporter [Streptomyces sp. AV19]|uniref:DMT family transporter n=1 Tax=Streptomyces sp. AV19 TaxID=2793068 RepID=UPI0018FE08CE|nr:DMT family transporter [Streptomyces sp. AV19]MBH1934502.1 DMT family transporter [Streptomyces sp. AV19]MDG4533296.1 DMT family transporter [Streptomyces sp. AV19]